MKNRIKQYINVLFKLDRFMPSKGHMGKSISSLVLLFASFMMLIINYLNEEHLMTLLSIILVVGFLISFIFAYIFKKTKISGAIIGILVSLILSIFALTGGNGGFAILWILLVPLFAIYLLDIKGGLAVSTYFLIFVIVLFYTPLKDYIADKYTHQFISRFPILFLSDYLISCFLSLQKEFYYRVTQIKSYTDELTGCLNRRFFMEQLDAEITNPKYGIILIDVNGLKTVNDTKGHKVGDQLIKAVPTCFNHIFGIDTKICRIGGDEFAILTFETKKEINKKIKEVKEYASNYKDDYIDNLSFSIGYASNEDYKDKNLNYLFIKADELMYKDKSEYYKKNDRRKKKN